jgi:protein phosphatase
MMDNKVSVAPPNAASSFRAPWQVQGFGLTDVGRVRERNEDAFVVLPHVGLFAVADGIGGLPGGDVAARILVTAVRETLEDSDTPWSGVSLADSARRRRLLVQGVERANCEIQAEARRSSRRGMGTTFAGILMSEDQVMIAHVGDSRVYRLRGRHLELLTVDHSFVNQLLQTGVIRAEDIPGSRIPNLLARSVGAKSTITVDTRIEATASNDTYLVCTDGLHDLLKDDDIAAILSAEPDPCKAVHTLIRHANEQGGFDNITAVAVRLG